MRIVDCDRELIDNIWEKFDKKLSRVAVSSRHKIPYTTVNGVHDDMAQKDISWWTNGFWGGLMWLMYSESGNEDYRITAEIAENTMDGAFENFAALHHDVGFMWHIMSGAAYRLTGNTKSLNRNLFAAATLAARYNADGGYIRAWNGTGNEGWSIIDCMMNIPLLYWASDQTGDDRFKRIAVHHADMAMRDHVRPDGSIYHIVEHNTENGEVIKTHAGQGYDENSCWSRGLAWAIYGFVLSYIHTGNREYLDTAVRTANFYIANCAATGYASVVDFRAPKDPVYYDSTAGVIAACGMIEIAGNVSEAESRMYIDAALNIIRVTDEKFCNYGSDDDAVVHMGTERYHAEGNKGIHIPIIYGDFFFAEAVLKLRGNKFLIW